ncbi:MULTISPECIES: branched-chain amino acid ABC transporter substrate-binding protein [unclassified Herbaspirillum]|uniref:branched-chain amino acid ABC transporter substrate-binding protein n=1 Tax=unclassified Herbaspirillum TaxID=2624150 RepID=UPI00383B02D0
MNFMCVREMSVRQFISFFAAATPVVLCGLAALLSATPACAADDVQTVLIGFAGGLGKRSLSNLSFSARDGAQMAVDDANQRNLVIGGKRVFFKLLVSDDQSDVNFARVVAKSFVTAGVVGVVGHVTTDTSIAAAPFYNEAGIPQISPTSAGRQFSQTGYRTAFQILGHSEASAIHLANVAYDTLKARRIVVIDNSSMLGTSLAETFTRQIRRDGGDVLFRETINSKTSDFNAVLPRVKNERADLLFFAGTGPQAIAFSQNAQRMGVTSTLLLNGGAVNNEFPQTGSHRDGTYLMLQGLPVETRSGYSQFEKAYRKKFDSALTAYTMFSYDAVGMLIEACRKNNSLNARLAVETLHNMQYAGISGTISFAPDGSKNNPPYTLYRASQNKWQIVKVFGG